MLKPASARLMYPSHQSTAGTGVVGSLPGSHPPARAMPRKIPPRAMLVSGPTIAMRNSDLASGGHRPQCTRVSHLSIDLPNLLAGNVSRNTASVNINEFSRTEPGPNETQRVVGPY